MLWSWSQVALVLGVGHVRILGTTCPWIPGSWRDSEAIGDAEMLRSAYWCGAQWCHGVQELVLPGKGWLDVGFTSSIILFKYALEVI